MPGLNPSQQDIEDFISITNSSTEQATHFLATGTTLQGAIEDYFAAQGAEDPEQVEDTDMPEPEEPPRAGGGMTLDGRPAEGLPEGWGRPERTRVGRVGQWSDAPRTGELATLGHDDDDDEDEDPRRPQEFYTGGERSGLAVQNPDAGRRGPGGLVDNILRQAASATRDREPEATTTTPFFRGAGNTLGTDETPAPSEAAPGPRVAPVSSSAFDQLLASMTGRAQSQPEPEPQTRQLIFWRNGFSIEDGPLHPYDNPQTQELLEAIQSGRAPPTLFNVRFDQPLTIQVSERRKEDYHVEKKPAKAFEGSGNRLGSPTREAIGSSSSMAMPGGILQGQGSSSSSTSTSTPAPSAPTSAASFAVDDSKPTTSIQVRLGDGTRLVARVNLTHTVGDLRNFVTASRPDNRPFVLQTTFPSKELSDFNATIEEAQLKNAVVVQRFT
ncbi:ubiquitin-related domain-containing protein [Naematelia encephala]|uniref:Ubiquitin-related domain-containing protein n=1 Tax=Naematelia encephala TaxID=71784 RepID=A0A1Y2B309_9TREE|nr:ubiquitin-related domain-containing protein [Naematelia encephala]